MGEPRTGPEEEAWLCFGSTDLHGRAAPASSAPAGLLLALPVRRVSEGRGLTL